MISNCKSGRAGHSPLTAWIGVMVLTATSFAATIDKTNNADNLSLGSSWVGGTPPGPGDIAQWSSVVPSANTTSLGANLSWSGIKLTTPGGAVTLNAGNTLALASAGLDLSTATSDLTLNCALNLLTNERWSVGSGRTLTIGGSVAGTALLTLPGPGGVTFNGGSGASYTFGTAGAGNNALALNGGTVNFQSGTLTLNENGKNNDAAHLNGNVTFNLTGGTVNSAFYTRLGSGALGTVSTLNVSGGSFNNTGEILFGFGGPGGSGTLNISGGTVDTHFLRLGDTSASGTHTVNLDGGVLKANRFFRYTATTVFNFNGGLLMANYSPTTPWFAVNAASVYVKNGGALIDTNGKDVTIEPGLQPFSSSTGGLTKLGAGSLTLAGTNTYTGPTAVSNGTLAIKGRLDGPGAVTIASGGMLGGTGVVAGAVTVLDGANINPGAGRFTVGSLTLNPNATLALTLGAAGNPANSSLRVNGNLVLAGNVSISDAGGMSTGAVYSVINYTGTFTNLGLTMSPNSQWAVSVDTSVTNYVRIAAVSKNPFIEITNGNFAVSTLTTNLGGILRGTPAGPVWYEVRDHTNRMWDFGATLGRTPWSITVRHLRAGTNTVTVFAQDGSGTIQSNRVQLTLTLGAAPGVRPRPIPSEIWWGGLSDNTQMTNFSQWPFVQRF